MIKFKMPKDHVPAFPSAGETVHRLILETFRQSALDAIQKEHRHELTNKEACAIFWFAGVPYTIDPITGKIAFEKCGLAKIDGKWTAFIAPEATGSARQSR